MLLSNEATACASRSFSRSLALPTDEGEMASTSAISPLDILSLMRQARRSSLSPMGAGGQQEEDSRQHGEEVWREVAFHIAYVFLFRVHFGSKSKDYLPMRQKMGAFFAVRREVCPRPRTGMPVPVFGGACALGRACLRLRAGNEAFFAPVRCGRTEAAYFCPVILKKDSL